MLKNLSKLSIINVLAQVIAIVRLSINSQLYGADVTVSFTNMHNKCYQHLLDLENNNEINELVKSDIINLSSVFKSGIGIIEN